MSSEVIKDFLVTIGFEVDKASLSEFNASLANASKQAVAVFAGIQAASAGVFYGISNVAEGFEKMGYEMRLIAPSINRVMYMRQQMMASYAAAGVNLQQTIVSAVRFNMAMEKTKYALEAVYRSVAAKFFPVLTKQMDVFRHMIFANMPKIQHYLETMVKFLFKAFEATVELGSRAWSVLKRLYDFFKNLHDQSSGLSTIILAAAAAWVVLSDTFLATPLGATLAGLAGLLALYDDFKRFQAGKTHGIHWEKYTDGIEVAQKIFSTFKSILEGVLDTIGDIVLAIYNLAHGNIDAAARNMEDIRKRLAKTSDTVKDAYKEAEIDYSKDKKAGEKVTEDFNKRNVEEFKNGLVGRAISGVGDWFSDLFNGSKEEQAARQRKTIQNTYIETGDPNKPLISPGGNKSSSGDDKKAPLMRSPQAPFSGAMNMNQNLDQQTTINIMGVADANAAGNAVAYQQNAVNRSLARNFQSAVG